MENFTGKFFTGFLKMLGENPQLWQYPSTNLCDSISRPFVTQVVKFFKVGNIPSLPTCKYIVWACWQGVGVGVTGFVLTPSRGNGA